MKNSKKLVIALGTAVLAIAILVGAALALFSDTETGQTGGTAGTVDLTLDVKPLGNKENINPGDSDPNNPPGSNKGTDHSLVFDVANLGNKSIYNRNVIVLSVKDSGGINFLDARVLRLYETTSAPTDATKVIGKEVGIKYYVLADETEVAATIDGSGKDVTPASAFGGKNVLAIKYVIDKDKNGVDLVLNGDPTKIAPETETGYTSNKATYHYLFSMDRTADNYYQGSLIQIDVISQAMQYRNAVSADWQTISQKTISTRANGYSVTGAPTNSEDKNASQIVTPVIPVTP